MTTATPNYPASSALTFTGTSLASDTNLLIGRQSAAWDNGSLDALELHLGVKITTAGALTANRRIEIWAFAAYYDGSAWQYPVGGGATDAALTIPSAGSKACGRLLLTIPMSDTTARTYRVGGIPIGAAFGGIVPERGFIWISQDSGAALSSTASDHELRLSPFKAESA